MNTKTKTMSKTSKMHYAKLIARSVLLIAALIFYIIYRLNDTENTLDGYGGLPWVLGVIWIVYAIEIFLRFFPSDIESPGCQKQFARNFRPTDEKTPQLISWKRTFAVTAAWLALNAAIGLLYYTSIIDRGVLILISLTYGVCDMICILFFCPFQTWFMKNRCCCDCSLPSPHFFPSRCSRPHRWSSALYGSRFQIEFAVMSQRVFSSRENTSKKGTLEVGI